VVDHSVGFWNFIAERYARKPVPDEAVYQEKLAVTQRYFRPEMDVLEFGCGTGSTAIVHAPHVKSYLAIDVSPKMIEIAERKLAGQPIDNLTFERAALEELEAEAESFDAVLGMSILHLVADRDDAIRRVHEMLKPGGVFVSSTTCVADTMPWFRFVAPVGHFLRLMPRVVAFTRRELTDSLARGGFRLDYEMKSEKRDAAAFLVAVKAR
jgi:2-polyprenyl-3-methyl-5-hydroxy-6-metoxy-1,4-benzoquinol methylase